MELVDSDLGAAEIVNTSTEISQSVESEPIENEVTPDFFELEAELFGFENEIEQEIERLEDVEGEGY
jgi:hypothetical protein